MQEYFSCGVCADYIGVVIAFSQVRPCFADGLACRPGSVRRSVATIHLRVPLPTPSSDLPAHSGEQPSGVCAASACTGLLDLAPGGVCRSDRVTPAAGGLLLHRFTLTPPVAGSGGLFSVALSRGLPRVGVTHHLALWSPDLPRRPSEEVRRGRPASPSAGSG